MKRLITIVFLTLSLMFIPAISGQASAIEPTPSYSGEFMFTYKGNDNPKGLTAMLELINNWFNVKRGYAGDYLDELAIFDKYDNGQSNKSIVNLSFDDNKGGSWSSTVPVEFYAVKGGNYVAMYWIEGGARSGFWSMEHIINGGGNVPDLSHMSVFNPLFTPNTVPAPTPEPATVLLMGAGLLGMLGIRKRFKK